MSEDLGGHLVTIHSDDDWDDLVDTAEDARKDNSDLKYIWIGGTTTIGNDNQIILSWVDDSETNYVMSDVFDNWYYNETLDLTEPSGYDAYEWETNGTLTQEPYVLLWYVDDTWSLNDVPDLTDYSNYKDSNMAFIYAS